MSVPENSARENTELSERELEILRLVATGASNKEIAQQLFISANTVKVHLRNIFAKIGTASRTEAALYAVRTGLVKSGVEVIENGPAVQPAAGNGAPVAAQPVQAAAESLPQAKRLPSRRRVALGLVSGVIVLALLGWLGLAVFQRWPVILAGAAQATPTSATRWRELASMPTPRHSLAVAVYENFIYAIAGEGTQGVTGIVERFDPQGNTWTTLAPKPSPVYEVGAAVVGGLIYVPGGRTADGKITSILEVYDPQAGRWESRAELPEPLSGYALIAYEGRLYVFGGWNGQKYSRAVYGYEPGRDEWKTYSPMPTGRAFSGAAVAGGKIYIIGGFDGRRALQANEVYIPERDDGSQAQAWEKAAPLPQGCFAMGTISLADSLYVAGGEGCGDEVPLFLMYSPVTDSWHGLESTSLQPFSHAGVVGLGPRVYILGGRMKESISAQNLAYQAIYTISIPLVR